ncbi:two-partner secretion domain-containing protein [Pseudomonas sp. TE3610]
MDVRQLAFLARQPSAAIQPRERFWGISKRGLAFVLANALFWQPLWAQAGGITVSGQGTTTTAAANGVPIVNIAAPNASGLSHNQFGDYNVGSQGLILNNATGSTQSTQLGGIILGNSNLKGHAASTILNEVTGNNRSQLEGYTEVAGQAAHVIVANPYGITCNGCGFINTPKATLTTGKPVLDANGKLDHYQVDGGDVAIDGSGVNAGNVDSFEVITRSARINAQINANQLSLIAGRNDVDANTLKATTRADDGSAKPNLAIDSTALGGMYAGAIKLVGTEKGVGVNLAGNLAASAGDIELDANGQLNVAQAAASGAVTVNAQSVATAGTVYAGSHLNVNTTGDIVNNQSISARDAITLSSGGQLNNSGIIEAGVNADNSRNTAGDVSVSAQNLTNSGSFIASRNLTAQVTQTLVNQAGTLSAGQQLQADATTFDNQGKGRVLSSASLALSAGQLLNTNGLVTSNGVLNVQGGSVINGAGEVSSLAAISLDLTGAFSNVNGLLSSEGTLDVSSTSLDNTQGSISSAKGLSLTTTGSVFNQGGAITTDQALTLNSTSLDNRQKGKISGSGATRITTGQFDNGQGGSLTSGATLNLNAGQVINGTAGRIASTGTLTASVNGLNQQGGQLFSNSQLNLDLNQGQLTNSGLINAPILVLNNLADVDNSGGEISSAQAFSLSSTALTNTGGKLTSSQGLTLAVQQALNNVNGMISAAVLTSRSATLDNTSGTLSSQGNIDLGVTGAVTNQHGTLISDANVLLSAASLDNTSGSVSGKGDVSVTAASVLNQNGELFASGALSISSTTLDNRQNGLIGALGAMTLNVGDVDNRGGELSSGTDLSLTGRGLDNSDGGLVIATQSLGLSVDQILNRNNGQLTGKAALNLTGQTLDNTSGVLSSLHSLQVGLTGYLTNTQGLLSSEGLLAASAAGLSNRLGSLSSAGQLRLTTTGAIDNQGGQLVTDAGLDLHSASLDNSNQGTVSASQAMAITTGSLNNQYSGSITGGETLALNAGQVSNGDGGSIAAQNAVTASVTGLAQNGGKLFSNSALTLDLNDGALNNQAGLINAPVLVLKNIGAVDNSGGEISSAQAFDFSADSLTNDNGKLLSNQALTVTVNHALSNLSGTIAAASLQVQAASLNNAGGTLNSQGDLNLTVSGQLTNSNLGLINANGTLAINAAAIDNSNGGNLLASAIALDFGAATGDLNNAGGLITTTGQLTVNHLRDLNNQNGELSSSQSLTLAGRTLDNTGGKLISDNLLTLTANSLLNPGGLVSGWQGVTVTAGSLDNRNTGTVSSRYGDVTATVQGDLLNGNNGALVSQGALNVSAGNLDNSAGILSSAAGLTLQAISLTNNAGSIAAQNAFTFTGTTFDNSNGSVTSNGAGTLNLLDVLTNTNGKLATGADLLIQGATQVNNQHGQLASQTLLTLLTTGLDNSNSGTIAANDALTLTATGAVQNNADGLIYSQNADLNLSAASLANSRGTLQSQTALNVTTTGDIDNQSGTLLAQGGDLSVNAGNLDSRGGILSSQTGSFTAQLTGVLKNGYDLTNASQKGTIQAQGLNLTSTGLNNDGGRIAAQTGDAVISTGDFNNQNGGLYATGKVKVTARNLDNSGAADGQIGGQQIDLSLSGALNNENGIVESDSTLGVTAASIDNQGGQLRALGSSGTTLFTVNGLLNNSNGTLETANSNLALNVGALQNQGGSILHSGDGTFGLGLNLLQNAGGSLVSNGNLSVTGDSWTNSSVLQVGDLTVNVGTLNQTSTGQLLANHSFTGRGGNWNNDGLIASNGSADLQVTGSYGGAGGLTSVGDLTFAASQVNLSAASSRLTAGGNAGINVGGVLTNQGRITANGGLTVNAGTLDNYGTLGAAQDVTLSTPTLLNEDGLIFAGGNLALQANTFTNHEANVYGLSDVSIAGFNGVTRSASVSNISGGLESAGAFTIDADAFENRTEGGTGTGDRTLTSGFIAARCNDCKGDNYDLTLVAQETFESTDTDTSAASTLSVGKDFVFQGGTFLNSKSTIAAGGNITIQADTLQNVGSVGGTIQRTRTYETQTIPNGVANQLMVDAVVPYNQRNNPNFPLVYYIDDSGAIRTATAVSDSYRDGGRDGTTYKGVKLTDTATGQEVRGTLGEHVYGLALSGLSYGFEKTVTSQYAPGNLLELPAALTQYTLVSDVETATDNTGAASTGTIRNAVIQAAGTVAITASQTLTNSVIHEDYGYNAGANQVQNTQTTTGPRVVVRVNAQLPPDLAQQEVDPLTLPGFSLPTGQNGLFRISGQGTGSVVAPKDWTLSSGQLSGVQTQVTAPVAQARAVKVGSAEPASSTSLSLGQSTGTSSAGASITNQTVARVQGVPDTSVVSQPQKYLIETNPALTSLKQFMSSDYMLSALGYNPDDSEKRLGDGLYEQTLVDQAVVARTGQRYIDGETSDAAQFKYLMDNGIAAQQTLNLTVGTALTADQVAALTHDIVWMQSEIVDGQTVLVPVVYLANANNRLAPTGALIAGTDVNLVAGQTITNAGTVAASNSLSATAGTDVVNSGVLQAGGRLDVLASNNVVNQAGGIIAGRDVGITAVDGNVTNERTVSSLDSNTVAGVRHQDFSDNAARIEAANGLTVNAGNDVTNQGSVLQSVGATSISAGRDVALASTALTTSASAGKNHTSSSITQLGSTVTSGGDLTVQAGRDLSVVASQLSAKGDVAMAAAGTLDISSAANETHSYSKGKHETRQEDHVHQVSSDVTAGNSITLQSGSDLTLESSHLTAGTDATVAAGGKLNVLAAQDTDYSLYDMKKKGSFGSKRTKHDEVTQVTNIGSVVTTGGNLTLASNDDQLYQAAKLNSGNDLTISSGGAVTFEGVKDLHQETHTKSSTSLAWNSMKGKGSTNESLQQTEITAKGKTVINAVNGLNIDVKQINKETVSQVIDTMVKADPSLSWIKDAEARGDVNWQQVAEIHNSFKYSNSGLGAAAQLVLAIALAALTGGAGAGLVGATAGSLSAGIANATLVAVENTAINSAISNKGNLGATLKDTVSSESLKGYVVSGLMGGIASTLGYDPTKLGFNLNSVGQVVLKTGADTLVQTAINGGSLGDNFANNLLGAVIDIGGAVAANKIGNLNFAEGSPTKIAAHALLGGLKSMAMGGDFKTGALAGGANEATVEYLAGLVLPQGYDPSMPGADQAKANLLAMSQLVGVLTAVVSGGDPSIAANIAANATQYNYLDHSDLDRAAKQLVGCGDDAKCVTTAYTSYQTLSQNQEQQALVDCGKDPASCARVSNLVAQAQADTEHFKDEIASASPEAQTAYNQLIAENDGFQGLLASVTSVHSAKAVTDILVEKLGISPERAAEMAAGLITFAAGLTVTKVLANSDGSRTKSINGSSANAVEEGGGRASGVSEGSSESQNSSAPRESSAQSEPDGNAGEAEKPVAENSEGKQSSEGNSDQTTAVEENNEPAATSSGSKGSNDEDPLSSAAPDVKSNTGTDSSGVATNDAASTNKGPKVPQNLQAFSNPPQGPVIPSDWISRPGKTPGSTIYYPPGTEPSDKGSTYIRLMPAGSTPVPGLENGYWISVKNGQPINPATGGTGTKGETHVPLPPDTVPPTR